MSSSPPWPALMMRASRISAGRSAWRALVGAGVGFRRVLRRRRGDFGRLLAAVGAGDGGLEFLQGAEAERDRMARLDVGRVPMRALAHRLDGRLGRADELRDLPVAELGMALQEPGDGVGLVLALGDRRVA